MTQAGPLCGFLNVLKPPGMSSAQVVGYVRRLLGGVKAGHAGTLDPEAAGVLPVMVGKAARLFDDLQDKDKEYVAEVAFGVATDTQDAQGIPVVHGDRWPDEAAIRGALPRFTGEILQTPPMYSALKQDGQRLYDLARRGREAVVPARKVTVHSLRLMGVTPDHGALLSVCCSKGFYVRTLCHDLGEALGLPGAYALSAAHAQRSLWPGHSAYAGGARGEGRAGYAGWMPASARSRPWAYAHGGGAGGPGKGRAKRRSHPVGALCRAGRGRGAALRPAAGGTLLGVAQRRGDEIKVRTWLAE